MGQSAQNNEGNELKENPFEGDVRAANKVKKLNGDREVGHSDQEITHFLALQNALKAP